MTKKVFTEEEEKVQIELMTHEDKPKLTKLERLQATQAAIQEELRVERLEAVRKEQDRRNAEQAVRNAIEQKNMDITLFNQTNEMVQPIIDIVGIKDATPIIVSFLMLSNVYRIDEYTSRVAIRKVESYFREQKAREEAGK
jgi:hypothetical protein